MKQLYASCIFLLLPIILHAQDTIYMKSGVKIPAVIIEKNDTELKYKKFISPESAAIYSLFISDVQKVRYKNGNITEFNELSEQNAVSNASANEPPGLKMKFLLGASYNYFMRNTDDGLLPYWRTINNNNELNIGGEAMFPAINIAMLGPLDRNNRNWIGASLQLALTGPDGIYASHSNVFTNEIKLQSFYYNIGMSYGRGITHSKKLVLIIEPGLDMGFLWGKVNLGTSEYKVSTISASPHLSTGINLIISKRLVFSTLAGYRFITGSAKEEQGQLGDMSHISVNGEIIQVNMGGSYVYAGLSFALYSKVKTGRPE
jgi:hypothetical protein